MGFFSFLGKKKDNKKPVAATTVQAAQPAATPAPAAAPTPAAAPAPAVITPNGQLQIVIDNELVSFNDGFPYMEGGDVMVPARELCNHLGANVGWDANTKTVTLTKDNIKVEVVIGATTAKINGNVVNIGTAAVEKNSRIFLPIRFLADNMHATFNFDSSTKIVTIKE